MPKRRIADIPIDRIKPSPYNPRHEAVGIEDLATSIRSVGIIEPLVVAISKDDPESVELVCGNRRFAAALLADQKSVPCVILPAIGERGERTISLVENLHRREMSHIEQGEAFRDLVRTGMTQIEVARATGVSDYVVSTKITLVEKLIPEFQELVHRDRMTLAEAGQMAKLPMEAQRRILAEGRGTQPRQSKIPGPRRSKTEVALMSALRHLRAGSDELALAEVKRALGFLEGRTGKRRSA